MRKSILILFVFFLAACHRFTYIPAQRVETEFAHCYIEKHGAYYDSIPNDVMSIDLYSAGLNLDSTDHMAGTGTNLYLSDVFVARDESLLPAGIYTADTTGNVNTFLPGKDFEGEPTGTYILLVADGKVGSITLCTDSTMCVRYDQDTIDISFRLRKTDKRIYQAHYRGIPIYK